jgi:hypothetical protein
LVGLEPDGDGAMATVEGPATKLSAPEVRFLGLGAATALAANDLALRNHVPRIDRRDLAYEPSLAALWLVPRWLRQDRNHAVKRSGSRAN